MVISKPNIILGSKDEKDRVANSGHFVLPFSFLGKEDEDVTFLETLLLVETRNERISAASAVTLRASPRT